MQIPWALAKPARQPRLVHWCGWGVRLPSLDYRAERIPCQRHSHGQLVSGKCHCHLLDYLQLHMQSRNCCSCSRLSSSFRLGSPQIHHLRPPLVITKTGDFYGYEIWKTACLPPQVSSHLLRPYYMHRRRWTEKLCDNNHDYVLVGRDGTERLNGNGQGVAKSKK